MKKIELIQKNSIKAYVVAFFEGMVRKSGGSAVIYVPKTFLNRRAIVGIYKSHFNICDECGKPLMSRSREDSIRRQNDEKFNKKFCNCRNKEK